MAVIFTNNASSKLSAALTSSATALSINAGDAGKFPSPTAGDWFPLTIVDAAGNMEIVRVTARAGATLTIVRGQEGTSTKAFSSGAACDLRMTAAMLNAIRRDASELNSGTLAAARLPTITDDKLPSTMSGKTFTDVIVVRGAVPRIDLLDTDADDFFIRVDAGDFYILTDRDSSGTWETPHPLLLRNSDAAAYVYGSKVWTAANDGPDSGLDADTVDGVHLAGLVQVSRTITAGNGLTGLGDMSANRSVAVGAGTGITVGSTTVSVDGTVWRDGNLPTAAQIGGIIAGLTQGSIGSYAMAIKKTAGTINPGATVAGTDLYWSNTANSAAIGIDVGTWRAFGVVTNAAASLFERIS